MKILNLLSHIFQPTEQKLDFISELPPEMAHMILRKLDPESLLRAAQVSRSWMNICKSDPCLKDTARQYKNAKKLELEEMRQRVNDSLDCMNHTDSRIGQLKDYYNSCDYTQCANVFTIVNRINELSYRDQLDRVDEYSNLRFY